MIAQISKISTFSVFKFLFNSGVLGSPKTIHYVFIPCPLSYMHFVALFKVGFSCFLCFLAGTTMSFSLGYEIIRWQVDRSA